MTISCWLIASVLHGSEQWRADPDGVAEQFGVTSGGLRQRPFTRWRTQNFDFRPGTLVPGSTARTADVHASRVSLQLDGRTATALADLVQCVWRDEVERGQGNGTTSLAAAAVARGARTSTELAASRPTPMLDVPAGRTRDPMEGARAFPLRSAVHRPPSRHP